MKTSKSKSSQQKPDTGVFSTPILAESLEQTQISKYHTKGGHGFAAEDANNVADSLRGKHARVVVMSNELNGADRIVDGVQVQSKYFKSATETVGAAFNQDTSTYRYPGQILEVPKDQYETCVELMRDRIKNGNVHGVGDPAQAEEIVRQGTVTYKQARNIARAGSVDSLVFDVKTQAITCTYVFAVSFAVDFARSIWRGECRDEAIKTALHSSFSVGNQSLFTGIVSAQVLRTKAAALGGVAVRKGIKVASGTTLGREFVHRIAAGSTGRPIFGGAAINHVSKLLRTNAVTGTVAVMVTSIPDFYRAFFDRSISYRQFIKNVSVTAVGVAGSFGGYFTGMAVGGAVGSLVPGVGTAIGGVVGGLLGCLSGGFVVPPVGKKLSDRVADDDSTRQMAVLDAELPILASEYLLSDNEAELLISDSSSMINKKWLRQMFKKTRKLSDDELVRDYIRSAFEPVIEKIVRKRPKITLPQESEVENEVYIISEKITSLGVDECGSDGKPINGVCHNTR